MQVLSRKRLASAALLLSLSTVCANISFVRIPPTILQPGETIELQWNIVTPTAGTLDTQEPFNLQLRALSGQRYDLNKLIPQAAAKLRVVIPKEATGGLHSFYADYTGPINVKPTASNQFNITGAIVTTTTAGPTSTLGPTASITAPNGKGSPSSQSPDSQAATDQGLSGGAIGGIIAGVVIFLLLIALIFFARHRRLVRERNQHTRLDDSKESYSESVMARSGPPSTKGGDGMVSVPLSAPAPVYPSPFSGEPKPQPQRPMNQMQHANGNGNPFDAPEDRTRGLPPVGAMAIGAAAGSPRSLSPRQQHQPYQPPQFEQQPPRSQQQQYGVPPQQRGQSPFQQGSSRDSLDSEPESAYDPAHARMMPHPNGGDGNGPIVRNNSNPMMQRGGPPGPGSQLAYSPSGRSVMSDVQNMSHPQPHPHHQQQQNPFHDRELLAAAAGGAAVGAIAAANRRQGSPAPNSPAQAHRHLTPMNDSRVQTPLPGQGSPLPRSKEIEMQPLDVQQHQYEQQQRMLQRQQQQRQQAEAEAQGGQKQRQQQQQPPVQPIQQTPLPPTPVPAPAPAQAAASHPFNPTLYDDKTEIDDDGMPVYNGYRDTIFGAYSQPLEDSDDDDDDETAVPVVPTSVLLSAGGDAQKQQQQQRAADAQASSSGAGAGVQRKKSVKFTGVPLSDSIDVPVSTSQQQHQQQLYHSDGDDDEDEEDGLEDEDDIKMRLMQTEVPSPASAHARPPFINTTPGSSPSAQHHQASVLSPVRSPDQAYPSSSGNYHQSHGNHHPIGGGFPVPAPIPASAPKQQQQQQQQQSSSHATGSSSPSLNTASSSFGNGFYEDVLAAVDKNAKSLPSSSTTASHAAPPQKHQPVRVDQEVYGAPSPRVSAAVATPAHPQHVKSGQQPSMPKPYQQPPQQQQQQNGGEHNAGFYESPLL
ncbi:hypothetical protein BGZ70_010362 [Mortierella alpina]|uniref:Uncharacterized protein n=1 Tax=Mortierella alpina TaxID=64518 RepID=A0A9P6IZA6_MORAP|nr:hypothetical protein BGZ70_010362 [Mortierella alpina]